MSGQRGKFITFEGIEGVGKSTQIARLGAAFSQRKIAHIVTREPGGTPLAERIRAIVLSAEGEAIPPAAELTLMFAARAVHVANRITPALASGSHVLCDRFTDASYAYQGAGRGMDSAAIAALEAVVLAGLRPDLTLLLDMPVDEALQRARARGAADRFEREGAAFFDRIRQCYLHRARTEPHRFAVIDASPAADIVFNHIASEIASRLNINIPIQMTE